MKPRVLELIGSFVRAGSERQGLQLSRLLAEDGHFQVFVGCLDRSGPLLDENPWLNRNEIPEFKLKSFYDGNFVTQVYRCAKFLRSNQISVIHTHDFYTNIFGMLAGFLARVPARIASKRETFSKTERQTMVERNSFRLAHQIVCNSAAVREFLANSGVPASKLQVIYNGLDAKLFSPISVRKESVYKKLGRSFDSSCRLVTIVANIRSDVKNHSMFLRSAKSVLEEIEEAEFIIAGEGELETELKKQARAIGIENKVHFIGSCAYVPSLLAVSDVCVLSSRSEGFSNAILEYMAAGKPVVATRVGGAAEAILEGETGFIVESDDDQAMARRIIALLRDSALLSRFGENGRKRVGEMFSLDAQLIRTKALYEGVLSQGGKHR
jgi:L-malate glycosyltransferase